MRAAVEVTVIDSNNPSAGPHTDLSWVVSLDSDSGPSTVRTFIARMHDVSAEAVDDTMVNAAFSFDTQASCLVGKRAIAVAWEKPTSNGGTFTRLSWKLFNEGDEVPDFKAMMLPVHGQPVHGQPVHSVELSDDIPF